jgi:phage shock protein PspC (stress-responsive transcriptional regulator)
MKRKLIVALVCAGLASWLGIQSGVVQPVVDAIYCVAQPDDCK